MRSSSYNNLDKYTRMAVDCKENMYYRNYDNCEGMFKDLELPYREYTDIKSNLSILKRMYPKMYQYYKGKGNGRMPSEAGLGAMYRIAKERVRESNFKLGVEEEFGREIAKRYGMSEEVAEGFGYLMIKSKKDYFNIDYEGRYFDYRPKLEAIKSVRTPKDRDMVKFLFSQMDTDKKIQLSLKAEERHLETVVDVAVETMSSDEKLLFAHDREMLFKYHQAIADGGGYDNPYKERIDKLGIDSHNDYKELDKEPDLETVIMEMGFEVE